MVIISVSATTEILKSALEPAGNLNGIPSYYSYGTNFKKSYVFNCYMEESEITDAQSNISFFGYKILSFLIKHLLIDWRWGEASFNEIQGNIINVAVGPPVYFDGKEFFNTTITLVQFPEYSDPSFNYEEESTSQLSIVGYYINGKAYIGGTDKSGTIKKKVYTSVATDTTDDIPSMLPLIASGTADSIVLSKTPSNFRYVLDKSGGGTLYADYEEIILEG